MTAIEALNFLCIYT